MTQDQMKRDRKQEIRDEIRNLLGTPLVLHTGSDQFEHKTISVNSSRTSPRPSSLAYPDSRSYASFWCEESDPFSSLSFWK